MAHKNRVILLRVGHPAETAVSHPNIPTPPFALKYIQKLFQNRGREVFLFDALVTPDAPDKALTLAKNEADRITVILEAVYGGGDKARELAGLFSSQGVKKIYLGGADPEMHGKTGKKEPPFNFIAGVEFDMGLAPHIFGKELTLDELPAPDYSSVEMNRYRHIYPISINSRTRYGHVLAGRGCPHRCAYCTPALRVSSGFKVRMRPVESVAEEVRLRRSEGATVVLFGDDDLSADRRFLSNLALWLAKNNKPMPFIAHARIDELNKELLMQLSKAG